MLKAVILLRKKIQWYFRETSSKNIYAENIKNKKIVNFKFEEFIMYL
jgi:hypothetical protein